MTQSHEEEIVAAENAQRAMIQKKCSQPPRGWLKCNINVMWDGHKKIGRALWVLRDDRGVVLMHSRRGFLNACDINKARLNTLVWAIESMVSHRMNMILFAIEDSTLVGDGDSTQ
ncbi:hypothetical protein YC2023_072641 [Brassica napus]